MKLLTKEEEDAHYRQVVKGGTIGGMLGLVGGLAGVMAAARRYHTIRNLTLPMKAFLVTSTGTFVGIVAADSSSRAFEAERNQQLQWYEDREQRLRHSEVAGMSFIDRALIWARREKYKIVGATWVASMIGSFVLVGRNPYLSGQQKIVQARVYAQGLTLAVLVASAAFEISDQKKGKGILDAPKPVDGAPQAQNVQATPAVEENQGGDLWKDMVAAEEERLKKKHVSLYDHHDQGKHGAAEKDAPAAEKEAESEKKQ
ncbi:conserved hypothetical protein [Aspergillus terreus NIH2624]|uniref:HIG1 domain-containing protein n=1 Tax=Aspergillus terreus (strain NIH 2624 / FGSC A1156) TaxID=341663 RepID=Q0D0W1_ASPTN|nr:uncharacterized protein ATEG_00423 [Aspergillus terreus NIH2624]EAU39069.1 conserved hypothetical protein [Aspergillus terreus NIH2624]